MIRLHNGYEIDDARKRLDFERVHGWLTTVYWSPGISRERVEKGAAYSSLVVGVYKDDAQVAYLRVVSDRTRFAYICDVYVDEAHRRQGIAKAMVRYALEHPDHQGLRQWLLATSDAHGVYGSVGFTPLPKPERWMTFLPESRTSDMLTLVATPIGNLGDITLRALDTLREADMIASEDTRKTGLLLKHFDIRKPQMSFHEHNEERAAERILALLQEGKTVALVTNAGTPGISDPGYRIVRKAIENDCELTLIPGPTAFVMALVLSGLAVHSFTFRGFPPRKPGPRRRFFAVDRASPHTLIYYESPYRLEAFLRDALEVFGDRQAALANDLTKKFESVQRGTLSELLAIVTDTPAKGEYIFVIAGAGDAEADEADEDA